MCSLCAVLGGSRHWTDAAGQEPFSLDGGRVTLRAEREKRVGLLNRVLAIHGITLRDWGGTSFVLEDGAGRRENVYNLAGIWEAVHGLLGTAADPLDPALLDRLAGIG